MKTRIAALSAVLCLAAFHSTAPERAPTTWSVDHAHSRLGFKVRHLGISNVRGDFREYDAMLSMEGTDLSTLSAEATIQTASINTDNDRRDNHLRSPDFFAAEEHPEMTFVSTGVRSVDGSTFEMTGNLTIRGTTHAVVLDAEFLGSVAMGEEERAGFEATTTIDRMDYGLAWDRLTEAGGLVVGHEVEITLELEVIKD